MPPCSPPSRERCDQPKTISWARSTGNQTRLSNTSPISAFCQKNFVMLLTDGLPTGKADGSLYSAADRTDTNANGVWNFGTAANDSFTAVTNLRTVPYRGCNNCVS
jgi:type IV pilus assembly protein PilY1